MSISFTELAPRLAPELTLLGGAALCLLCGLSPTARTRQSTMWVAVVSAVVACLLCIKLTPDDHQAFGLPEWPVLVKGFIAMVGLALVLVQAGVPDRLKQILDAESNGKFEPGNDFRGEFFAFTLVSIAGAMLCVGARDLVWLLLAIELTSLPTYIMIASGRDDRRAKESAIKYFFLGALAVAVFLYGASLMYGATGTTEFADMRQYVGVEKNGTVSPLMLTGVMLAIVGLAFKVAAAPMHAYTLDVYQGAATPVTALISTLPKFAGFSALTLVLGTVGWFHKNGSISPLPNEIIALLTAMAIGSMFIGNGLGLLQGSLKRTLGCSSIAQSGYLMLGLIAGPGLIVANDGTNPSSGLASLNFYLLAYAMSTIGLLAAIGALVDDKGHEIDSFEQLRGLRHRHPVLAVLITLSALSLMGLPALGGFIGKLMLGLAILDSHSALHVWLVIALVVNSAISAGYYLRFAALPWLGVAPGPLHPIHISGRRIAAMVTTLAAVALGGFAASSLIRKTATACSYPAENTEPSPTIAAPRN